MATLPGGAGDPERFHDHDVSTVIRNQVASVVAGEGPVHLKVLGRRIADQWGIAKLTVNPMRRITEQLQSLVKSGAAIERGEFDWPAHLDPTSYREFRAGDDGDAPRELPHIPPEEIANAAESLLRDAGSLEREALAREVARVFGVQRLGANVRQALDAGLDLLVASGRAVAREDRLGMPSA
jgi:hypothetical protein